MMHMSNIGVMDSHLRKSSWLVRSVAPVIGDESIISTSANTLSRLSGSLVLSLLLLTLTTSCLRERLDAVQISLVGVNAVLRPPTDVALDLTCEMENANSSWVEIVRVDYCVHVGGWVVRCGVYPSKDNPQKVKASGVLETQMRVIPRAEDVPKLMALLLQSDGRLPEAYVTGTAELDSPVGRLSSEFQTGPVRIAIRNMGVSIEMP